MDVPFSYFIDFLLAAGTSRVVTAAKQAREARGIPFDLYRPFKVVAVDVAAGKLQDSALDALVEHQQDRLARKHYPPLVKGMRSFLRRMARAGATYQAPPAPVSYPLPLGYAVSVNPELGFVIDGALHIVKLYCRMEPLDRARVEMSCGVLAASFGRALPSARYAVLAVREGKLCTAPDAAVARAMRAAKIDGGTYAAHREG